MFVWCFPHLCCYLDKYVSTFAVLNRRLGGSAVLKRAAKSRLSSSADSLVKAERMFRSKRYEEELKQMRESHKKNMEKEDLLRAACAKRETRFLEHQEQLQLIRLEQEQVILERERYIAERERYNTEQAKLAMRAAQLDVERKELDIKKFQGDK